MEQSSKFFSRFIWTVLLMALMLVVAACVPITPPAQTPAPAEEATEAVTDTITATVAAEEESGEEVASVELSGILTGTVMYLQRIALPEGSVIEVVLQDVSLQDVAATAITSQTITTTGEQVPIPFELIYDPTQIDPRFSYALSVRITIDGELAWLNTERYAVLTHDAPVTDVEVMVQQVQ